VLLENQAFKFNVAKVNLCIYGTEKMALMVLMEQTALMVSMAQMARMVLMAQVARRQP
jgi:hypothetical protein